MSDSHSPQLDAALRYLRQGWAILPLHGIRPDGHCTCGDTACSSPGKHPRMPKGVHAAVRRPDEAQAWWELWPDANVGIATGLISGLVVLDIDPRHGGTLEALGDVPPTMTARTGGGGWHIYFRWPPMGAEIRNSAGKLAPGIDVRGTDGYVVAPPSRHVSGESYAWEQRVLPVDLPSHLLARLLTAGWPPHGTPDRSPSPIAEREASADRIPLGQRNEVLTRLAGALRRSGLTGAELEAALQAVNLRRCVEPLAEREVRAIAQSVARYAPGDPLPVVVTPLRMDELVKRQLPPVRWIVPNLLPEGLSLLVGKPKLGKSWLALHLVLAVASGGVALGTESVEPGEALYLALEDPLRRLQDRVRRLWGSQPVPEGAYLQVAWPRLHQGGAEQLDAWLAEHPTCRLVVVDTLAKIKPPSQGRGSIYDEEYAALGPLKQLAEARHVAVLVVHHLRKQGAVDPVDEINGTTGLTGAVDGYLILRRKRGSAEGTLHVTGRDVEEQALGLRFAPEQGRWEVTGPAPDEEDESQPRSADQRAILEVLRAASGPLSPKEIAQEIGKSPDFVRLLLHRLKAKGLVTSATRGCWEVRC